MVQSSNHIFSEESSSLHLFVDQEKMISSVSSIAISPIQTSPSSPSSPNQPYSSSANGKDDVIHEESPLQQRANLRHGRNMKSDPYSHCRRNRNTHKQYHTNQDFPVLDESRDNDNDNIATVYDSSVFAFSTSFRSMVVIDSPDHEVHSEQKDKRDLYVYEMEQAPSDGQEEDQRIYEMNLTSNSSFVYDHNQSHQGNNNEINDFENDEASEENEEERLRREEEESEALARQLMAEEAMASYAQSSNFLRAHANEYSEADLLALEALMAEEDPMNDEAEEDGDGSEELSYDALLRLGDRIGDVKAERWAMRARQEINKLQTVTFCDEMVHEKNENDCSVKCLVCQCEYENGEKLSVLPCSHTFHKDCIEQWLLEKEHCPYCRQSIADE